ncbi:hypothetical protein BJ978_001409 [Agromyces terreus]|uniref:DUF6881 domain-containing protein n=1 Tax=Agromyces terreus TaxID=424795 RepID=A0A9X2KAV2_9MICO|nr:hypothetical protein [Agromyces terreus]MCP2370733.1 hypothetical protein [Agromyces terreus]
MPAGILDRENKSAICWRVVVRYIRVRWNHEASDDPVLLYSEIDDAGWEVRKVEEYRSGIRDRASRDVATGRSLLGLEPIPPLDEINASVEFDGAMIGAEDFERVWAEATPPHESH